MISTKPTIYLIDALNFLRSFLQVPPGDEEKTLRALAGGTALLSTVEIKKPKQAAGLTTETQIQSGLIIGTIGLVKEIINRLKQECFKKEKFIIIGTGGLGRLFEKENIFDFYEPDLILLGLSALIKKNK